MLLTCGVLAAPSVLIAQSPRGGVPDGAARASTAVLSGVVLDERARPIAGADVTLPRIASRTLTNDRGEFRFADLSAGDYEVVVRRIGYRELTDTVSVPSAGIVRREYSLRPITTLDTVAVSASAIIPSFEDHRRLGLGKFLTRADLAPQEDRRLSEILVGVGAHSYQVGFRAWVTGLDRGPKTVRPKCVQLEGAPGLACKCFVQVYLDNTRLYNGSERGLVPDVNGITPASLEAIEFYRGPAQTPLEYSSLNSQCGVLVLHSRKVARPARQP